MSKELLKRVRDTLHELEETHYDLYWDIQAELDKPEQEPIPVYTSPPKCEPPMTGREMHQRGYAAAERDLKREPLSEATVLLLFTEAFCCQGNINTNFAKSIEREHGIGGGE